jgi:UDP-N-acetyl-D-mannosaminuronate dehydrogenase
MVNYAVSLIENHFHSLENRNILILGLSFRENVKEVTKSSTLLLIDELKKKGVDVYVDDPQFSDQEIASFNVKPFKEKDAKDMDAIILQAFHDEYKKLKFEQFTNCKYVLDGRNKLDKQQIEKLGIVYRGIGKK